MEIIKRAMRDCYVMLFPSKIGCLSVKLSSHSFIHVREVKCVVSKGKGRKCIKQRRRHYCTMWNDHRHGTLRQVPDMNCDEFFCLSKNFVDYNYYYTKNYFVR